MAIRNIVKHGDPVLRKTSRTVLNFDERLALLLYDMKDTMYDADGVGLAAPQVGILRRVCVIDIGEGLLELVNPVIIEAEGEQQETEGCLSLPGNYKTTSRPAKVMVRAQNRNGETVIYEGEGLLARAFCHELDHLDGVLFIDKAIGE